MLLAKLNQSYKRGFFFYRAKTWFKRSLLLWYQFRSETMSKSVARGYYQ